MNCWKNIFTFLKMTGTNIKFVFISHIRCSKQFRHLYKLSHSHTNGRKITIFIFHQFYECQHFVEHFRTEEHKNSIILCHNMYSQYQITCDNDINSNIAGYKLNFSNTYITVYVHNDSFPIKSAFLSPQETQPFGAMFK